MELFRISYSLLCSLLSILCISGYADHKISSFIPELPHYSKLRIPSISLYTQCSNSNRHLSSHYRSCIGATLIGTLYHLYNAYPNIPHIIFLYHLLFCSTICSFVIFFYYFKLWYCSFILMHSLLLILYTLRNNLSRIHLWGYKFCTVDSLLCKLHSIGWG